MSLATPFRDKARQDDDAVAALAMMAEILGCSERCPPMRDRDDRRMRVEDLMRLGARTDAALELIGLELPQWQVRRLAYDGGEWHCALSCRRELPEWLDGTAEARNADLALAILAAGLEARSVDDATPSSRVTSDRSAQASDDATLMCCDNFA